MKKIIIILFSVVLLVGCSPASSSTFDDTELQKEILELQVKNQELL